MKRCILLAGSILLSTVTAAQASTIGTSIGVEFGIGGSNGIGSGLTSTQVAGVVPTANWNIAANNSGTLTAGNVMEDTHGAASVASGVTVSWATGDTWNNGGSANFANANDNILNDGYLDGESGGHATVTFTGLTPGAFYDVYITSTGGTAESKGGNMVVNGVDDHGAAGDNTSGVYVPTTPTVPGNYHFFVTAADASGDISILTGGSDPTFDRIPINSVELEIITPEPSSLAAIAGLCGMGLVGLIIRRRRRSA